MNTVIVGIGHKARHGKDSAARFIHEAFPAETKLYSFAAGVRAVARAVLGMEEKDGPLLQLVGTEVFRLEGTKRDEAIAAFKQERWNEAIEVNTKAGRTSESWKVFDEAAFRLDRLEKLAAIVGGDPDVWVRSVKHLIAEDNPRIAILTDMRFPNEVAITDETIKVTRLVKNTDPSPGAIAEFIPFVAPDRPADHPSETALDGYAEWSKDIWARDGDMKGLRRAALTAFNQLMMKRGIRL